MEPTSAAVAGLQLGVFAGVRRAPRAAVLYNYWHLHSWKPALSHGNIVFERQPRHDVWAPFARVDAKDYILRQFHCHTGAEHGVPPGGRPSLMECHFVHVASDGARAVVGVFLPIPSPSGPTIVPNHLGLIYFAPIWFTACDAGRYAYWGSLTTGDCDEGIAWTVHDRYKPHQDPALMRRFFLDAQGVRALQARGNREVTYTP